MINSSQVRRWLRAMAARVSPPKVDGGAAISRCMVWAVLPMVTP